MSLETAYAAVAPAVVALGSRLITAPPGKGEDIPKIFGTGFVVDKSGLVITAGHVARDLMALGSAPDGYPLACALLYQEPTGERGVRFEHIAPLVPVMRIWQLTSMEFTHQPFHGEDVPDVGMVQLGVCELPTVEFAPDRNQIRTGRSVAFAGFPLGDAALRLDLEDAAPVLLQTAPFLRTGIISSVHPFPIPSPHGFTIDGRSDGGASGSPIFETAVGRVLGMLYAAFPEHAITYALPSGLLKTCIKAFLEQAPARSGFPTLAEFVSNPTEVRQNTYGRPKRHGVTR